MPITLPSRTLLAFLATGHLVAWVSANEPPATLMPKAKLEPFLKEHCIRCHGPEKQKGDVRFDEATWEITNNDIAQRWQDVLDVLNGGDMPPEDEKQPSQEVLSHALDTLTGTLLKARKLLTDRGGEIAMRRLNRREYANTIRDLFGFIVPAGMIPEDGEAASFDTVGTDQFFTSNHFEKYLDLGREIVAHGFNWAGRPREAVSTAHREPEENVTQRLRETLADLDNKMRMKNEGKTWKEMGFEDAGEAEVVFSQFKFRAGKPRQYLQYPQVESGIYLTAMNNETRRFGINRASDPRGTYRFRIRGGIVGEPLEIRQFVRATDIEHAFGVMRIRGTETAPEVVEIGYQPTLGQRNVSLHIEENRADVRVLEHYLTKLKSEDPWASIWIDWLEIEGPFYPKDRAFFETLLHPQTPERGKQTMVWNDANARDLIERFAIEAFRHREPEKAYVDELVAMFETSRAEGQKFDQAMGEVMAVVLASPGFLFLQEASKADGKRHELDARELAIRLAYFLWSSAPDAELYRAAGDGSILKPEILRAQVDRMLLDARSLAFTDGFASQWAALKRFDAITIDETVAFRFNQGVRHSATREVLEFFRTLVAENLPASNLIDSDFVVINSLLGAHYGIAGVKSDAFQKVKLPAESPRGGLLGQAAFLIAGSNGERSSPVIRGALVMEKLLHDKPPPPPPNVPELGSASKTPLTNRQLVEAHQKRAQCASCHQKMDVIGFGLENFDVIGQWRDTETVGRKEVPIATGGTLPGGGAFADIDGLKAALLNEKDALARELVESLLAYSLGRTIEFSDADAIEAILHELKREDYPVRSMIHAVTASRLFQTK
jgi:mono/diheme cytochrome c family protein